MMIRKTENTRLSNMELFQQLEYEHIDIENRYQRLFETSRDGILILYAQNGMIIDVNPFLLELLGYSKEMFIKKQIWEIEAFTKIVGNRDKYLKCLQKRNFHYYDLPILTLSGKKIWVELVGVFYFSGDEKLLQFNIRDITMHKLLADKLVKAKEKAEENDKLKSAFLANMSHEIRTPMNGILGFAELLNDPKLSREKQQKYIAIIENSGMRMLSIVNDIINISKVESGQMQLSISETDIVSLITFICNFFQPEARQKGLFISFLNNQTSDKVTVNTDKEKVYAILTNLVKNAIKFTTEGFIEIGLTDKNRYLELYVKDTGPGISQHYKEIIFERFKQGGELHIRKQEGAGLGLAISKAYTEMLGGEIWLKSEVGKGATFYFTLPLNGYKKDLHLKKS